MTALERAAKEWADALDARFHDPNLKWPRAEPQYTEVVRRYAAATEALYHQTRMDTGRNRPLFIDPITGCPYPQTIQQALGWWWRVPYSWLLRLWRKNER